MSIHHGKNAKASRRERRKALRAQRAFETWTTGRWPHSELSTQNFERVITIPKGYRPVFRPPEALSWIERLRALIFRTAR